MAKNCLLVQHPKERLGSCATGGKPLDLSLLVENLASAKGPVPETFYSINRLPSQDDMPLINSPLLPQDFKSMSNPPSPEEILAMDSPQTTEDLPPVSSSLPSEGIPPVKSPPPPEYFSPPSSPGIPLTAENTLHPMLPCGDPEVSSYL